MSGQSMVQKQRVIVSVDTTTEQLLAFDQDASLQVCFDLDRFKKLSPDVQARLSLETVKSYAVAEAEVATRSEQTAGRVRILENPLGNTTSMHAHRLQTRKRDGYHTYWAKPGADYDRCVASGAYVQIRKPTKAQEEAGFEVGEEEGEPLKIVDGEGKVELIAMECREEDSQTYLEYMSQQSRMRYEDIEKGFVNNIEQLNEGLSRGSFIKPGVVSDDGRFKSF